MLTEAGLASVFSSLLVERNITYSPRNVLLFLKIRIPVALITRLVTGRADIPVITSEDQNTLRYQVELKYLALNTCLML